MADFRSPLAKARDEWLDSKDGKMCADGITRGVYLRNRLEQAFIAGWNARDKSPSIVRIVDEMEKGK